MRHCRGREITCRFARFQCGEGWTQLSTLVLGFRARPTNLSIAPVLKSILAQFCSVCSERGDAIIVNIIKENIGR